MNIHEYQAKKILRTYGLSVPNGKIAHNIEQALEAAEALETESSPKVMVVKAQVYAGGRGKAGGVKLVKNPTELRDIVSKMLGMTLITPQTGKEGVIVKKVYIEEGSDIKAEYYLSVILDRNNSGVTFIASTEGGMDIEEVAESHPEKIIKVSVDPTVGLHDFHIRKVGFSLGFNTEDIKKLGKIMHGIYKAFIELDANQIEINPLIKNASGDLVILDAKFAFDENALFRQPEIEALREHDEVDALEEEAMNAGLSYVKLDGDIGCMVNGAGLAMATMDLIQFYGGTPANFLDVGGGATKEKVEQAFKIILSDQNVKGVLINIFGGIMRCDVIATGVVEAAKSIGITCPVVVRLAGTNADLGQKILENSGLKLASATNFADAANKIVNLVKAQ